VLAVDARREYSHEVQDYMVSYIVVSIADTQCSRARWFRSMHVATDDVASRGCN